MGFLGLFVLFVVVIPVLFVLFFFDIVSFSFEKLGLSPETALLLLVGVVIGSIINIPLSRRRLKIEFKQSSFSRFFYYNPPKVGIQTIAINLGGALIPIIFSIYLLSEVLILPMIEAIIVVSLVIRFTSKIIPGRGIVVPLFIPPIISAILALILASNNPAPFAFVCGTIGTLIGADLLNLHRIKNLGPYMISIGGAGVFDGIFLTGIVAVIIA
jgi:uncharacterized membrane protein